MNVMDTVLGVIKTASEELDKVNDLNNWSKDGITHIYVFDLSKEYRLVGGVWVEAAPF